LFSRYVQLPRWARATGSEDRPGPYFESPSGIDFANGESRRAMIRQWFSEFLFQQGYTEFEPQLDQALERASAGRAV
jgi:hypothetical protein